MIEMSRATEAMVGLWVAEETPVDLTRPYVWSVTTQQWVNSGCGGCEYHIPDASPETTALIERIDRELGISGG